MKHESTPALEHLLSQVRDPQISEVLRAGTKYGDALRDLYTPGALELLARRIIALEERAE